MFSVDVGKCLCGLRVSGGCTHKKRAGRSKAQRSTQHTAHTAQHKLPYLHEAGVEHEQLRERLGAVAAADLAPPHFERLQAGGVVLSVGVFLCGVCAQFGVVVS